MFARDDAHIVHRLSYTRVVVDAAPRRLCKVFFNHCLFK